MCVEKNNEDYMALANHEFMLVTIEKKTYILDDRQGRLYEWIRDLSLSTK